ncbi:hypothetical protein PIB30_045182 [Stylosanthes scabra]|uniref:Uncharacterized protein n=1 Tax=Stylosanthes scabra TaxID=79078 RepID=A0ABU6YF05_9FABA|nr:hypothetical protein [Stylosanthes scabra]
MFVNQSMYLLTVGKKIRVGARGQDSREGEIVGINAGATHAVEVRDGKEWVVETREVGDEGGESDNIGGGAWGGGEEEEGAVDGAAFGVKEEEVVEKYRVGGVVGCDELGVDLGGVFEVLELGSVADERIEVIGCVSLMVMMIFMKFAASGLMIWANKNPNLTKAHVQNRMKGRINTLTSVNSVASCELNVSAGGGWVHVGGAGGS